MVRREEPDRPAPLSSDAMKIKNDFAADVELYAQTVREEAMWASPQTPEETTDEFSGGILAGEGP